MILNAFMKIYDFTSLNGTCKSFQTNVYLIFVKRAFTPKKISGAREDLEYASSIALPHSRFSRNSEDEVGGRREEEGGGGRIIL